jgi:hypothetical protein
MLICKDIALTWKGQCVPDVQFHHEKCYVGISAYPSSGVWNICDELIILHFQLFSGKCRSCFVSSRFTQLGQHVVIMAQCYVFSSRYGPMLCWFAKTLNSPEKVNVSQMFNSTMKNITMWPCGGFLPTRHLECETSDGVCCSVEQYSPLN